MHIVCIIGEKVTVEKREEYIKIYLTDFEKEKVKRKANEESMSVSTYGRRKLLEKHKE